MTEAILAERPARAAFPGDYLTLDRRWLCLAGACCLWALAFWQLAGPVAGFLTEAARVRMMLPYHIHWVSGLPWGVIAVAGSLSALAVGPRLRPAGNIFLVGAPLLANVVIHGSLYAAQSVAVRGLMMAY